MGTNDGRALVNLALYNRKLSIRKMAQKFNTTRQQMYSHETIRQELQKRGLVRKYTKKFQC